MKKGADICTVLVQLKDDEWYYKRKSRKEANNETEWK